MTMEHMGVRVEVWPVGVDESGFWLLSGGEQLVAAGRVPSDGDPDFEAKCLLSDYGMTPQFLHSTSWRFAMPNVVVTYIAVVNLYGEPARDRFRDAMPIDVGPLMDQVGAPKASPPLGEPTVRDLDVLLHAIRHLAYLARHDVTAQDELGDLWHRHLASVRPDLARMFRERQDGTVVAA